MADTAVGSERRVDYLARHRPIPDGHVKDRRSVYWVDKQPPGPPTVMAMTPRLEILSKSRHLANGYKFNRDRSFHIDAEPFYREIKPTSKNIPPATPRIEQLSSHKQTHPEYRYDKELPTEVKMTSAATPRIEELARSKTELWQKKGGWPNEQMYYTFLPQPVTESAMKAAASPRIETLSEYKPYHSNFKPERPIRWDIQPEALTTNATLRVCQLARPRSRTLVKDDDWDPYVVAKSARHAQITPRVEELALPLPRKQRSKKVV